MGSETVNAISDLASFTTEAELPETPFRAEPPNNPLWQFPEEGLPPPAVVNSSRTTGQKTSIYPTIGVAVVTFVAATAAGWWGAPLLGGARVTSALPRAMVLDQGADSSTGALRNQPARLIRSATLPLLARTPVPRIVPRLPRGAMEPVENGAAKVVALVGAKPETRQRPERAVSITRGTSGAASASSTLRFVPRSSPEPLSSGPLETNNSALGTPAPPAAVEASAAVPPPGPRPPAPAMRPEPEALPSMVARTEQSEIQRTLGQYRNAYQLLDAESARAVWPSVDVRALARAFDSLTSQQLAFETCEFDIVGEAATAQCRGSATYTPKVGNREPKLEPRQWTFQLRKAADGWKIHSAQTRR